MRCNLNNVHKSVFFQAQIIRHFNQKDILIFLWRIFVEITWNYGLEQFSRIKQIRTAFFHEYYELFPNMANAQSNIWCTGNWKQNEMEQQTILKTFRLRFPLEHFSLVSNSITNNRIVF